MENTYAAYKDLSENAIDAAFKTALGHYQQGPNGCFESTYATDGKNYAQVRYERKKYYVHVIAAIRRHKRVPIAQQEEVSHLCHNRKCFNPSHLEYESGPINKSRGCCALFKDVSGYKCPHEPTCIGATPIPAK